MLTDNVSEIEQRAWASASSLSPMPINPIPAYCEALNNYYDRAAGTVDATKYALYKELNDWRTKTLTESGFWDHSYSYTDDRDPDDYSTFILDNFVEDDNDD